MSLPAILRGIQASSHPFIVLESSASQSSLPILRAVLSQTQTRIVLCNLLYPLKFLVDDINNESLQVIDWSEDIAGYKDVDSDFSQRALSAIKTGT